MLAHIAGVPDFPSAVKPFMMLQMYLFSWNISNKLISRLARLYRSLSCVIITLTTTSPAVCVWNHLLSQTKPNQDNKNTLCVARTTVVSSCVYNGVPEAALNLPGNHTLSCRRNSSCSVDRLSRVTCAAASIS